MRNLTGQGHTAQGAVSPEHFLAPHTRRQWLGAGGRLLLGAWAPLLVACHSVQPAPLALGLNAWVGYDPLVLARERGVIDTRAVKVIELSSGSETMRLFRNRLLHAAALTLDEALRLADEGFDPRVVAVLSASVGADVVMAVPQVRNLAGLRGRTVAVEGTTVGALMLQRLLQAAGLKTGDVKIVNVEATQHLELLRGGRAEVAISYEPLAGALREAGMVSLFDSWQMPGDIVDVLVVHADVLESSPDQVQAMLAGWQLGLAALQESPGASAALLAPGAGLTPAQYMAAFNGLEFYSAEQSLSWLSGQPKALGLASERLSVTLKSMRLIRESPDWARLLVSEPAERLLQAQGTGA